MVARFLGLLGDPSALSTATPTWPTRSTSARRSSTLRGDISATETLAGLDEGAAWESSDGGVRIRQITGVLNIGISLANSGDNVVESVVTGLEPRHARTRPPARCSAPRRSSPAPSTSWVCAARCA